MTALNFASVLPEAILLAAACAVLVLDAFLPDRMRHLSWWATQLALVAGALACAWVTVQAFGRPPGHAMNGLVVDDMLSGLFRFFTIVAVALTLFYARGYFTDRGLFRGETFVLGLTTLLGMLVMISAGNVVTLYMR